jgi:hypothetical protein
MKISTENDNNCGYEKITIVVDNIPLNEEIINEKNSNLIDQLKLWDNYQSKMHCQLNI